MNDTKGNAAHCNIDISDLFPVWLLNWVNNTLKENNSIHVWYMAYLHEGQSRNFQKKRLGR